MNKKKKKTQVRRAEQKGGRIKGALREFSKLGNTKKTTCRQNGRLYSIQWRVEKFLGEGPQTKKVRDDLTN